MAVIIKRNKDVEPLDPLPVEKELPTAWTGPLVAACLVEAFAASTKLPSGIRTGYNRRHLPVVHDADDIAGQREQREIEREQGMPTCSRFVLSPKEVSRSDAALIWAMKYLAAELKLAQAVNAVSLAHAFGRSADWVARKYGGTADDWLARHDLGCEVIAICLNGDHVAAFKLGFSRPTMQS
jgi:hypothetical protein